MRWRIKLEEGVRKLCLTTPTALWSSATSPTSTSWEKVSFLGVFFLLSKKFLVLLPFWSCSAFFFFVVFYSLQPCSNIWKIRKKLCFLFSFVLFLLFFFSFREGSSLCSFFLVFYSVQPTFSKIWKIRKKLCFFFFSLLVFGVVLFFSVSSLFSKKLPFYSIFFFFVYVSSILCLFILFCSFLFSSPLFSRKSSVKSLWSRFSLTFLFQDLQNLEEAIFSPEDSKWFSSVANWLQHIALLMDAAKKVALEVSAGKVVLCHCRLDFVDRFVFHFFCRFESILIFEEFSYQDDRVLILLAFLISHSFSFLWSNRSISHYFNIFCVFFR